MALIAKKSFKEIIYGLFPICPLCGLKERYEVSGIYGYYFKCEYCGAKWKYVPHLAPGSWGSLGDLILQKPSSNGKGQELINKKYPVKFWISKISEYGPIIGQCPDCSEPGIRWVCSCGEKISMDSNCQKCRKEAPVAIKCPHCSCLLLNNKGVLFRWTKENIMKLPPTLLEKFPTCKYCGHKILDPISFPFNDGSVSCIECLNNFINTQHGVCLGCMKPINIQKEKFIVKEGNEVIHSSEECLCLYLNKKGMMTPLQEGLLNIAIQGLSTKDMPTKSEAVDRLLSSSLFGGDLWGVKRELQKQRDRETMESAFRRFIEEYYFKYPKEISTKLQNAGLYSLLNSFSIRCPNCGEMMPTTIKICPYCNKSVIGPARDQIKEEPFTALRLRYAKGEITKEQYEEMRKVLQS